MFVLGIFKLMIHLLSNSIKVM
uniref:Uncharacterized protein n=1 Tax=Arundo donax TaxID=35708 RepID=A0A0A9AF34_ARUDO